MIKYTCHCFISFALLFAPHQLEYLKHFLSSSSKKYRPPGNFLQAHIWIPLKMSVKILKIFPCLVTQNLLAGSNRHRSAGRLLNKRHLSHRGPSESTAVVPSTPPARQQVRATAEQVGHGETDILNDILRIFSTIFRDIFNVTSTETWSEEEIPWQPGTRPVAPSEFRRRAIVNELPSLKTQMSRSEKTCELDCVPCLKSLCPAFPPRTKGSRPKFSLSRKSALIKVFTLMTYFATVSSLLEVIQYVSQTGRYYIHLYQMDQN